MASKSTLSGRKETIDRIFPILCQTAIHISFWGNVCVQLILMERSTIMKKAVSLWLLIMMLPFASANAAFDLPGSLTEIGDQAFQNVTSLSSLIIPGTVTRIGASAFAGCSNLDEITIPSSVTTIGEGAFSGCGEALLIHAAPNSAASAYAKSHFLDYQADTTYRALVVGQTYTGTSMALEGPANDMRAVQLCLSAMQATPWQVTSASNLTANSFLARVSSVFASADEDDVSLLYYAGHGRRDGSLVGRDNVSITPQMLKSAFDQIPGRKIIIVDACYSGQLISEEETGSQTAAATSSKRLLKTEDPSAETQDLNEGAAQFVSAFQSAFRLRTRGALNSDGYYVITAALPNQQSAEGTITSGGVSRVMGIFSFSFCMGCGYNGVTYASAPLSADTSGDGVVSFQEAFSYAAATASSYNPNQTASAWPTGCTWFAPFRP